ncbi:hypothetical protein MNBD_ACTINO02-753 [hydrothermal vent metagenome]|uniref:Uncharacterized protein n=1 Tax=hydrothermal vent metagenome TaxID=652676 RepID=A0A3B0RY33_9ZZZZ
MRSRSARISLLALLLIAGSCTTDTGVSTTGSIPISTAPISSSPAAAALPTSTTVTAIEAPASVCGTDTADVDSVVMLPVGFVDPPHGAEFVGSRIRGLVSESVWEVPEPEGGVEAGDPETEAFLESFVLVRLSTAVNEADLPLIAAPWWAVERGFPESQELVDDALGRVVVETLFENRLGDGLPDSEEWFAATWFIGDLSVRMFTRGLGVDEMMGVARSVTTGIEVDSGLAFSPSERVVDRVSTTLGMTIEAALQVLLDSGFCEIEFMDVDGNPVSPITSDQSRIVGTEFPRADKLIVITDR